MFFCAVGETYVKQGNEARSVRLNKLARLLEQKKLPDKVRASFNTYSKGKVFDPTLPLT